MHQIVKLALKSVSQLTECRNGGKRATSFNLLNITNADLSFFRERLLGHPQRRANAADIPSELIARIKGHALNRVFA